MPEKLDIELRNIKKEIELMGELSRAMLMDSVTALRDLDIQLAEDVLSRKETLYKMDQNIEEHALKVLTLHQPMAKDMRTLACVLKMITYLTRIGRYGYDIAKVTKEMGGKKHIKKLIDIPAMARIADTMVDDVMQAFKTEDIRSFEDLEERDDILDEERYSIFRECVTYMMEDPRNITMCSHYIMIARYLERCGDHACKIAEKVHYMVTGEWVEIS